MHALADAIARHWPEYLIEAAMLATFMIIACAAASLFEHPSSPIRRAIPSAFRRRAAVGLLMGLTAIALIHSPWGRRSGAHLNPAVTLAFFALGKIAPVDAALYILAQFAGAIAGVLLARLTLGALLAHASVNHAATRPGPRGVLAAWHGEFLIGFLMMSMVLWTGNSVSTSAFTGLFAGLLVAAFITFEAPLSGMSLNPARTLASAIGARDFSGLWIYLTAPTLSMLAAAGAYSVARGPDQVFCGKLDHRDCGHGHPCLFRCRAAELVPTPARHAAAPSPASRPNHP